MKHKYILMGFAMLSSVVAGAQDITNSIARKTQAVSTISADEISKNATPNVSNTLYGLLPGLSVMQQTGWTDDAATLLRGYNNPLIVVDGFARPLSYLHGGNRIGHRAEGRCRDCRMGNTRSKRCDSDYHQKRSVQHQNANRRQL